MVMSNIVVPVEWQTKTDVKLLTTRRPEFVSPVFFGKVKISVNIQLCLRAANFPPGEPL